MLTLVWIGLLGGAIAAVSPCVLPVLPAVFFGSGTERGSVRRPMLIVAGLAVGFSVFTLTGSLVLGALHLPAALLRWAGLVGLATVGLGLCFPRLGLMLQRPFARLPGVRNAGGSNGFLFGLGLGTLYVPCAGPVLAAIALAGTTGRVSGQLVALTGAFAIGTAVPLMMFALAGHRLGAVLARYRRRTNAFRRVGGAVMVLLAVALTFNLTDVLQRSVPSYTQTLQDRAESGDQARRALAAAAGNPADPVTAADPGAPGRPSAEESTARTISERPAAAATGPVVTCTAGAPELANCGSAPELTGVSQWLNTPGNAATSLARLRGSVVLVDFWAFSCINCQHVQPYLNGWYERYRAAGLIIVGVHTPEFAFEKEVSGLRDAISAQGIGYPVAMDNAGATWTAFRNSYWPAEYLLDSSGVLRHTQFGEGGYQTSEGLIRQLLLAARPGIILPPPVNPLE